MSFGFKGFDFLGQILGPARRRRLETQARHDAQAVLDANKGRLVSIALQTVGAMPGDSAPAELHLIAGALLTQALASPAAQAIIPPIARPALTAALGQALAGVPVPDPVRAGAVGTFQIAAKVALADAIRALTL